MTFKKILAAFSDEQTYKRTLLNIMLADDRFDVKS
jgi:hypothetical protein